MTGGYAHHWSRVELARRDLTDAREADLATMESAEMALMIERLRSSLHDTLSLVEELLHSADR